ASTAQIEAIKLLGTEGMRGGTRLHWVAGGRVRALLGAHEARSEALRRVLGASDEQLVAQAEAKAAQAKAAELHAKWLEARLAEESARRLAAGEGAFVDAHFEGLGASFLRAVAQPLQELLGERYALLTAEVDGEGAFV